MDVVSNGDRSDGLRLLEADFASPNALGIDFGSYEDESEAPKGLGLLGSNECEDETNKLGLKLSLAYPTSFDIDLLSIEEETEAPNALGIDLGSNKDDTDALKTPEIVILF